MLFWFSLSKKKKSFWLFKYIYMYFFLSLFLRKCDKPFPKPPPSCNRHVTKGPRNLLVGPLPRDAALRVSSCADLEEWCTSWSPSLLLSSLRLEAPPADAQEGRASLTQSGKNLSTMGYLTGGRRWRGRSRISVYHRARSPRQDPRRATVGKWLVFSPGIPSLSPLSTASVTARHGGTCSGCKEEWWFRCSGDTIISLPHCQCWSPSCTTLPHSRSPPI